MLAPVEFPVVAGTNPEDVPLPFELPELFPVPVPIPVPVLLPVLAPLVPGGVRDMPTKTSFRVTVMVQSGFTL